MVYDSLGGQPIIDKVVDNFYRIMMTDPAAKDCYRTHEGRDLKDSSQKLKFFLSGWLGGPPLYLEHYGHPRLRMRHHPFSIGIREAEQWLYCMNLALMESAIEDRLREQMMEALAPVADMLINIRG